MILIHVWLLDLTYWIHVSIQICSIRNDNSFHMAISSQAPPGLHRIPSVLGMVYLWVFLVAAELQDAVSPTALFGSYDLCINNST